MPRIQLTRVTCYKCGKAHRLEEWDEATEATDFGWNGIGYTSITDKSRRQDCYFVCPSCDYVADGRLLRYTKLVDRSEWRLANQITKELEKNGIS